MAHNNKTPATILTAPVQVVKQVVAHIPHKEEVKHPITGEKTGEVRHSVTHTGMNVNPLTGEFTNPARPKRKAEAKAKRVHRNIPKRTRKAIKRRKRGNL
jgi:hypothetical protein